MHPEWNREGLWSKRDARQRRQRSLALGCACAGIAVVLGLANHACYELLLLGKPPLERNTLYMPSVFDECAIDSDCELAREITACGECPPAPPFAAITSGSLEDLRSDYYPVERMCDPPVCSVVPPGCDARAVCRRGSCGVVMNAACRR